MIKEALKPTSTKIVGIIVIFALIATYAFVPSLINPQLSISNYTIEMGYPLKFFFYTTDASNQSFMNFVPVNFIIDLLIFYFVLCLLSLILNLGRRKNVPNSDSRGRDSSTTNQTGV